MDGFKQTQVWLSDDSYYRLLQSFCLCLASHSFPQTYFGWPPSCFARWTRSFLSDGRACVVFQNHKSRFPRVRRCVSLGCVLSPVLSFLFIHNLCASLPSSVSCSLYADSLAIWPSFALVPSAVEATQEALIRQKRWSEYWCFPLDPSKYEASSQWIPTKLTFPSTLILLQLFLGSPSTAPFPFLNMYLC